MIPRLHPATPAALRNYVSMPVLRQNPAAWTAFVFVLMLCFDLPVASRLVHTDGVNALFRPHSLILTPIWALGCAVPAMLVQHYWRQVDSNLAAIIPGMMEAEFEACAIALVLSMLVLAMPMAWLGAPIAGALALSGIGMAIGGAFRSAAPTGQGSMLRGFRGLLIVPVIVVALLPHMLQRVVFAPAPIGLAVGASAVAAAILSLRFRPGAAAMETAQREHLMDQLAARLTATEPPAGIVRLQAFVLWKPGGPSRDPSPPTLSLAMGPAGLFLQTLLQFAGLLIIYIVLALVTGDGFHKALREQAPFALAVGAAVTLATRMQWLSRRGEWPFLMIAGWFGSRREFAEAFFRTHRNSMLQLAAFNGLVAASLAVALGFIGWRQAVPVVLVIAGLVFGGSYTPSLPLLWREFGGRGQMVACGMAGYMGVMFTLSLAVFDHGLQPVAIVAATLTALFGIVMAALAPRRLAAMDWPLED